jgi:RNA polymerase sigma factor (sigma-70 family)
MTKERLTQAEELDLITLAQVGDNKGKWALRKLIDHNTGLVHKVVSKFPMKNCVCSYDDLYQEGLLGFIHAIEKFDVTRNIRLSTYSYYWIVAKVRGYYHQNYRTVRLPVHVTMANTEINRTIEHLTREYGRVPTVDEVCSIHDGADNVICQSLYTLSLNSLMGEDGELQDTLGFSEVEDHDNELDVYLLLKQLKDKVSERDYNIIIERFGLDGNGERTLEELSQQTGVSRARCHQIQNRVLNKLREIAFK